MLLHVDDSKEFLIIDRCTTQEYEQLKISYNKKVKNYKFSPAYKGGSWDGNISFINGKTLPASTYKYLFDICDEFGFDCEISNIEEMFDNDIDYDEYVKWVNDFFKDNHIKPRYYQIEASYKMLKTKRSCISLCTSSGKTLVAFMVFAYLLDKGIAKKVMMVVPKIDLVLQPSGDFNEYNNEKLNIKIQQIYSGCKVQPDANIYIGTYQSLCKECEEYFNKFDCILVDECHLSTNASTLKILDKCKFPYRFGLSGTIPTTQYADGLTIISNFGPIVMNVTANQLQTEGYISDCKITQVRLNYTNDKQKEQFKQAKKSLTSIGKGKDMFVLENKFVHESEKRFGVVTKLISNANKNTLVLFQTKEYGKKIFKWLKENTTKIIYYIDGDIDKKVREEIRKRMEVNNDVILVASFGTSSTGISINNIFNIFFVDSFKSISTILQSIGRGLRKSDKIGKDFVNIYDISDDLYSGCYEMAHARERIKIYDSQMFPHDIKKLKI